MPTSEFRAGDVVRLPFPYTNRTTQQHRPALVVSRGTIGEGGGLLWVVMITSAENRPWPGDVPLGADCGAAGLPAPSVIRPGKIATIDAVMASKLGSVPPALMADVAAQLKRVLA